MSTPNYFSPLPNIKYAQSINKAGIANYIMTKDFFRLMRVRDDIFKEDTLYRQYFVQNGQRPEQISYELYRDERYYWVILQINDIYDFWNQWPLNQVELETFIEERYGSKADDIAYYETPRITNDAGDVLLEGGLVVSEDFVFTYYPSPASNEIIQTARPIAVTNRQKEFNINDKKSSITVLAPRYIYDYEREWNNYARRLSDVESESYIP